MNDDLTADLRERYPDATACRIAICELRSLLELPAGTTYYFCDIHGQGSKFFHIVNNKAGTIKRKIDDVLPELSPADRVRLLKVCYYPREELEFEASREGAACGIPGCCEIHDSTPSNSSQACSSSHAFLYCSSLGALPCQSS